MAVRATPSDGKFPPRYMKNSHINQELIVQEEIVKYCERYLKRFNYSENIRAISLPDESNGVNKVKRYLRRTSYPAVILLINLPDESNGVNRLKCT